MALVHLTGVFESGDNRSRRVPANPRHTINITQTETLTVRLAVVDANGVPIDLAPILSTSVLTVRKVPEADPMFTPRLGALQPQLGVNIIDFYLVPFDTRPEQVQPGRYIYDIWLTQVSGGRDPLIPTSPFVLEPTVNRTTDPMSMVPPVPLTPLTPDTHSALHQLIHFINEGPAKGFTSGAFKQTLPLGNPFPTQVIWWVSAAMTGKIVERLISRNPNQTPSVITWNMYGTDGITIVESTTDVISYIGVFETTRTRTIT